MQPQPKLINPRVIANGHYFFPFAEVAKPEKLTFRGFARIFEKFIKDPDGVSSF